MKVINILKLFYDKNNYEKNLMLSDLSLKKKYNVFNAYQGIVIYVPHKHY